MRNEAYDLPVNPAPPGEPVIQMRRITKVFHSAAGEATVLKGIDIDVCQGEFVSIVGRSGSGKSTLVNMLTRIDRPTSGTVQIGGILIHEMPEGEMAVWRGKHMGVVFQFFQLLPMLTLVENVMLPMDFCNVYPPASRESRAMDLLRTVGLEKLAHKLPGAVAGGQQQSAAVARALANDPPILIADEPTGNLDSHTAEQVMQIFDELVARGKTILMVTHDQALAQRTSRILLISDGELVDEAVAAAFPGQNPSALLQLSKSAAPLRLPPGKTLDQLIPSSDPRLFLLTSGELFHPNIPQTVAAGAILDPKVISLAELQATGPGADLLALPREETSLLINSTHLSHNLSSPSPESSQGSEPIHLPGRNQ